MGDNNNNNNSIVKAKKILWYTGNLSYKLHSDQLVIYNQIKLLIEQGQKEFALRIARQYGKSYLIVVLALEICIKNPKVIVRILGPTLDSIKNIVDDNLQPIVEDAPVGLVQRIKSDKRYRVGHSSLRIGTMERAHIDSTARGGNAYAIFCEECAASVKSEDLKYAVESVINPQLLRSSGQTGGGLLCYITTPADSPEHYFHTTVEPPLIKKDCFFTRTVYANPQLTPEQVTLAIDRCGGEGSEAWRREYLCQLFRSESIAIIPEFCERHIQDFTQPMYKRLYTCVDFGGSRDHHHAILYYWDYYLGKMYVVDEVHAPNQTPTAELIRRISVMESRDAYGPIARWGDLPGQLGVDLNSELDWPIQQTAKDDRDAALANLRNMFLLDYIVINPNCRMTIRTLQAGRWNLQRTDFLRSDELGHCDAIDALLYASRNLDKTDPNPKRYKETLWGRQIIPDGLAKLAEFWNKPK